MSQRAAAGDTVRCPRCGREESDPDVRFCPTCGTSLYAEPARIRLRRRLTGLFVVLTVLALVASVVAAWARAVALDTDRFVATVGPAIEEPTVQHALSVRLTDTVMSSLAIEDRVSTALASVGEGRLPISPALLAGPITSGIRNVLLERTEQLMASEAVRSLWYEALRAAHAQAVAVLRNESETASIEDGAVYLDLIPVINDALAALEAPLSDLFNRTIDVPSISGETAAQAVTLLEDRFGVDLPDDFGRVKVFESDALPAAQAAVAAMDRVVFLLVALTIVLAIVSLALSTRRLRTVLWLGLGVAIGLIVVRRLALRLDDAIAERVTGSVNRAAVESVTSDVFQDLRDFTTLLLIAALVVGVGAYLAGRPAWIGRLAARMSDGTLVSRESAAARWIGEHADGLRIALVVVGGIVLLAVNLGWASFLIVLVLLAAGWLVLTYLRDRVAADADAAAS